MKPWSDEMLIFLYWHSVQAVVPLMVDIREFENHEQHVPHELQQHFEWWTQFTNGIAWQLKQRGYQYDGTVGNWIKQKDQGNEDH